MRKNTMFGAIIVGIAMLIMVCMPVNVFADTEASVDGYYFMEAPVIDGEIEQDEWENADMDTYDIGVDDIYFYFGNDADFLYIAMDVGSDQTEDDGDDMMFFGWDYNEDEEFNMSEDKFVQGIDEVMYGNFSIDHSIGWEKTWENDDDRHRVYEFRIPLTSLGYEDENDFEDPLLFVMGAYDYDNNNASGNEMFIPYPEEAEFQMGGGNAENVAELELVYVGDVEETGVYYEEWEGGLLTFSLLVMILLGSVQLIWLNREYETLEYWQQWLMYNDRYLLLGVGVATFLMIHLGILEPIGQMFHDLFSWVHGLFGY